jgi:dephospho-CoA kinase
MSMPPVIGLTGGIGAGKSTVATCLKELGCVVVDADAIAHGVLDEPEVQHALIGWLGERVVGADGLVDRSFLGRHAFSNPDDLRRLEALVHPRVLAISRDRIAEAAPAAPAVVLDAPLLLETGLGTCCDHIVFIDTPEHVRHERLRLRSGWDAAEALQRESNQMGLDEKRFRSHHVLVNVGNLESLHRQVADLLDHIHPRHD